MLTIDFKKTTYTVLVFLVGGTGFGWLLDFDAWLEAELLLELADPELELALDDLELVPLLDELDRLAEADELLLNEKKKKPCEF